MKARYNILAFIFIGLVGSLGHFFYEWSGNNFFIGLFFPVNESTWEHLKLLFFPMFAYALLGGKRIEEEYPCIYNAMFFGILAGLLLIPILFYTYTGVLGFNVDWVNIAIYVISVIAAYIVVYKVAEDCKGKDSMLLRYVMYGLILAFMVFTVYPPGIGLFQAPPIK